MVKTYLTFILAPTFSTPFFNEAGICMVHDNHFFDIIEKIIITTAIAIMYGKNVINTEIITLIMGKAK